MIPNAQQPRKEFREEEPRSSSTRSVRSACCSPSSSGPSPARRVPIPSTRLIMGERRLRATKELGLSTIPAIVKDTPDDAMLRDALLENLHRAQLNPSRKPLRTSNFSPTSGSPRNSSGSASVDRARRSRTRSDSCGSPPRATAGRCRRALCRTCSCHPRRSGRGGDGVPGREDRQRGPVRPCC